MSLSSFSSEFTIVKGHKSQDASNLGHRRWSNERLSYNNRLVLTTIIYSYWLPENRYDVIKIHYPYTQLKLWHLFFTQLFRWNQWASEITDANMQLFRRKVRFLWDKWRSQNSWKWFLHVFHFTPDKCGTRQQHIWHKTLCSKTRQRSYGKAQRPET